jgi:hypothetical protein
VVRWGCLSLAFGLATLVVNVVSMLSHFFKPKLKPLTSQTSTVIKMA